MSVPIQEAAEALSPFLSEGVDAAVRDLGAQTGSRFSSAALSLIDKLRNLLKGPTPDVAEVEQALRKGLADGVVSPAEIRGLVSMQNSGHDSWSISVGGDIKGRNVNIGNTFYEGDHEE